jgi:hypothetical protein
MKIETLVVSGLDTSIKASGNPMRTIMETNLPVNDKDTKRATNLAHTPLGEGHDNFLNGIVVEFNITAPLYLWKQIQRYHFLDFVSSQSTMHSISKFDLNASCNQYVWKQTIHRLSILINKYNTTKDKSTFYEIISNLPCGFNLGATMVTNYRQLKTIYKQRKNHRLDEWKEFCSWIESLPHSYLITDMEILTANKK